MNKRLSLLFILISLFLLWTTHARAVVEDNEEVFTVREADFLQAVSRMNIAQRDRQELQDKVHQITLDAHNFYQKATLYKELSQTLSQQVNTLNKASYNAERLEISPLTPEKKVEEQKIIAILEDSKIKDKEMTHFELKRDGVSEQSGDISQALSQKDQQIQTLQERVSMLQEKISALEAKKQPDMREKIDISVGTEEARVHTINVDMQTENIQHPASSIQHPASSIQHPALKIILFPLSLSQEEYRQNFLSLKQSL